MAGLAGQGFAYRCAECDGEALWSIERVGDVAHTWACEQHFTKVALYMQRDHEVTELIVVCHPRAVEWSEIQQSLDAIANENKTRHYCGGYFDDEYLCPRCHMPTGNPLKGR